ncbi:MAG: hypothetical protein WKG07_48810 [Hymenobacter sp.]
MRDPATHDARAAAPRAAALRHCGGARTPPAPTRLAALHLPCNQLGDRLQPHQPGGLRELEKSRGRLRPRHQPRPPAPAQQAQWAAQVRQTLLDLADFAEPESLE